MDDFLKNFNDLKEKKTNEKDKIEFHEKFQEELKNIHPENSDINNLAKDYRILKEQELENSLSKPHEDYKKAEQEAKSLNDLVSKTKVYNMNKNLNIINIENEKLVTFINESYAAESYLLHGY